jgi:signal transduction histidine kinase
MVLTGIVSYVTYAFVRYFEDKSGNQEFNALAVQLTTHTLGSMSRKILSLTSMSQLIGMVCHDPASWPNCSLPMQPFFNITDPVIKIGDLRTLAFAPIVTPEQAPDFETYAYNVFEMAGYEDMGQFSFGQGIAALNGSNNTFFHDTEGAHLNNKHQILTPVMQVGNLKENRAAVMYNLYSEEARISAIDSMIDCFAAGGRDQECVSITDVIHLVQDPDFRPAVLVVHPVSALDDPDQLVGLNYGVVNWDRVFTGVVPEFVEGIDVVLHAGDNDYTFQIHGGGVSLRSSSDSHDHHYDDASHQFDIPYFKGSTVYSVSIYETDMFANSYRTNSPIYACMVSVLIMLSICGFVVSYDRSIQRDNKELHLVMDTKRQFVRFISHEMRTPLSIVQLGLNLVSREITSIMEKNAGCDTLQTDTLFAYFKDWMKLMVDIELSTDTAMLVLNDLIDYDKISLGGMALETELLPVWKLVNDTAQPFFLQARHAGVDLKIDLEIDKLDFLCDDQLPLSVLCMIADPIKMSQVIRNLLSNALKFTRPTETVVVSAYFKRGEFSKTTRGTADDILLTTEGTVVISVKDTGAGISLINQTNLFQEGLQFHANLLQAGGGSGLGLWITKGIVDLHGGTISVFSEGEGFGSTFTLEMPVGFARPVTEEVDDYHSAGDIEMGIPQGPEALSSPADADSSSEATQPVALAATDKPRYCIDGGRTQSLYTSVALSDSTEIKAPSNAQCSSLESCTSFNSMASKRKVCNILAVDDSPLSLKLVLRTMRRSGYTCYAAIDGLDCLNKLESLKEEGVAIDVILMDFEMPNMNGKLRAILWCSIAVILILIYSYYMYFALTLTIRPDCHRGVGEERLRVSCDWHHGKCPAWGQEKFYGQRSHRSAAEALPALRPGGHPQDAR